MTMKRPYRRPFFVWHDVTIQSYLKTTNIIYIAFISFFIKLKGKFI